VGVAPAANRLNNTGASPEGTDDIPAAEMVYRRLADGGPNFVTTDLQTGERRPSSGAFKPDDDGVSVYRHSKLNAAGLGPADLVLRATNVVVRLSVGDVMTVEPLRVVDDAWPADVDEPEHPRNGAHALITGWADLGKGDRRRRQSALSKLPSLTFVYPV
jgi:hypothetical protein